MCLRSEIDISWLRKNMLHTTWEKSKIFHSKRFRDFSNDSFKVAQAYTKTLRSSLSCNEKRPQASRGVKFTSPYYAQSLPFSPSLKSTFKPQSNLL